MRAVAVIRLQNWFRLLALSCAVASQSVLAAAPEVGEQLEINVRVHRNLLSIKHGEVSLIDVLRAIGEQAGIRMMVWGDPGRVWPQSFANLPLDEGIRRLVGDNGLVMIYHGFGESVPVEVRVYGSSKSGSLELTRGTVLNDKVKHGPEQPKHSTSPATSTVPEGLTDIAIDDLADALSEENADVRGVAVNLLARFGGDSAAFELEQAVLHDESSSVRLGALRGLYRIQGEDAASLLSEVVSKDKDPEVRANAVLLLGELVSSESHQLLRAARQDRDPEVRRAAAEALRRWRERSSFEQ